MIIRISIAVITAMLCQLSHAAIIPVTSVATSSTAASGTSVNNIIPRGNDGTITELNKLTYTTNTAYAFSAGTQYLTNNANNATFTFNFTGAPSIAEILIWNYSQSAIRGLDSISNVEVNTGAGFVSVLTNFALVPAGDVGFRSQVLDLPLVYSGVTAIRLTTTQATTGSGEFAGGFDEVAFSSVSAIPEPSQLLALGAVLLGWAFYKHR